MFAGDGMKGVTLSCHADVHLKVAQLVVKHTCWMIISKVGLKGRLIRNVHSESTGK